MRKNLRPGWIMLFRWNRNGHAVKGKKRKRLVESLQRPAPESIRVLRISNPDATAAEYLSSLEGFESTENREHAMLIFQTAHQELGEKLPQYLAWME